MGNKTANVLSVALLVASSFLVGIYVGTAKGSGPDPIGGVIGKENPIADSVDFTPFWQAWQILSEHQIDETHLSAQDKVWASIEGLASAYGDPYTVFFPPEENKVFNEEISGNFEGVGMEVGVKDDILTVVAPLKGTPAYNAGIKAGDKILKINDRITSDLTIDEAIDMMRGKKGTTVSLTIYRVGEEEPRVIEIVRDTIEIPSIDTETLPGGVFVISLYNFSEPANRGFSEALQAFKASGNTKLIIDVRGNPGGYLEHAVSIASHFLPIGTTVVKEVGRDGKENIYRSKGDPTIDMSKYQMVVLMDGGSASAAEILAGALAQNGVATTVGSTTFGKGSVQELLPLTRDTSLKITVAKWLTPDNTSLNDGGLEPDIEAPDDYSTEDDETMTAALNLLKGSR